MNRVSIMKDGKEVAFSRNLAVILRYARGNPCSLNRDGRYLIADYADGATCKTLFACENVLDEWIKNRIRFGRGKFRQHE